MVAEMLLWFDEGSMILPVPLRLVESFIMVHQEVVTLLVVPVNGYMASVLGTALISLTM